MPLPVATLACCVLLLAATPTPAQSSVSRLDPGRTPPSAAGALQLAGQLSVRPPSSAQDRTPASSLQMFSVGRRAVWALESEDGAARHLTPAETTGGRFREWKQERSAVSGQRVLPTTVQIVRSDRADGAEEIDLSLHSEGVTPFFHARRASEQLLAASVGRAIDASAGVQLRAGGAWSWRLSVSQEFRNAMDEPARDPALSLGARRRF